jgi:hypothetical protein
MSIVTAGSVNVLAAPGVIDSTGPISSEIVEFASGNLDTPSFILDLIIGAVRMTSSKFTRDIVTLFLGASLRQC